MCPTVSVAKNRQATGRHTREEPTGEPEERVSRAGKMEDSRSEGGQSSVGKMELCVPEPPRVAGAARQKCVGFAAARSRGRKDDVAPAEAGRHPARGQLARSGRACRHGRGPAAASINSLREAHVLPPKHASGRWRWGHVRPCRRQRPTRLPWPRGDAAAVLPLSRTSRWPVKLRTAQDG